MVEPRREWLETDYYAVLGIAETASEKEISKAYRKLARELHPDANPGDSAAEERFKEVSAANDVLGDPETRKAYDELRRLGPMGGAFGAGGPAGGPEGFSFDFGGNADINDLLGSLFGTGGFGGAGGGRQQRGRDQEAQIRLSFDEAIAGVTMPLAVGGPDGTRKITVRIPAGVDDGQRIRLRGKGGPGFNGGPPGDLFVIVRVQEHPIFGRDGANLTLTVPVTFPEAALGADIKVPTFRGEPVTLRLPPGTESGRTFRVKGKGVETTKKTGDLLVTVQVAVPQNLSRGAKQALQAFADEQPQSPRTHLEV